jgi:hypothetical protein
MSGLRGIKRAAILARLAGAGNVTNGLHVLTEALDALEWLAFIGH